MPNRLLIWVGVVLWCAALPARAQQWLWAVGPTQVSCCSRTEYGVVATDRQGGIFLAGTFRHTATFGPSTITTRREDDVAFLAKTNTAGHWQWARGFTVDSAVYAGAAIQAMATDSAGHLYIAGGSWGAVTFDGHALTDGSPGTALFVARLDSTGRCEWVNYSRSLPVGNTSVNAHGLVVTRRGEVLVAGEYFGGSLQIGATALPAYYLNGFVARFAPDGALRWLVRQGDFRVTGIALGGQDACFITGNYSVSRLDDTGGTLWNRSFPMPTPDTHTNLAAIATDPAGNVLVTGSFKGTTTMGPFALTSTANSSDVLVAKFSAAGRPLWVQRSHIGPQGYNGGHGTAIATDRWGSVYLTGGQWEPLQFGAFSAPVTADKSLFLAQLRSDGEWQGVLAAGGDYPYGYNFGTSIAVDTAGTAYVTGRLDGAGLFGAAPFAGSPLNTAFVAAAGFPHLIDPPPNSPNVTGPTLTTGNGTLLDLLTAPVSGVITPNGDGLNEALVVEGLVPVTCAIYNRWGVKIWHSAPHDYYDQWHGQDVSAGTYFYHLTAPDGRSANGWVEVIR